MRVERIGRATLYLGDAREVLPGITADHIIADPPYSDRTHAGHNMLGAGPLADGITDGANRSTLGYEALSFADARSLARLFAATSGGWIVWLTDHFLTVEVADELEKTGRYVFAPLPYFHPGRSVRLLGDGPCSWTDWIVVARTAKQKTWGTLPGGYVAGEGWNDKQRMGGKPTRLMRLLVTHYSRPNELICDPFMGAGTTGVACMMEGRDFIGVEIDPAAFELSCRRIEEAQRQGDFFIQGEAA